MYVHKILQGGYYWYKGQSYQVSYKSGQKWRNGNHVRHLDLKQPKLQNINMKPKKMGNTYAYPAHINFGTTFQYFKGCFWYAVTKRLKKKKINLCFPFIILSFLILKVYVHIQKSHSWTVDDFQGHYWCSCNHLV